MQLLRTSRIVLALLIVTSLAILNFQLDVLLNLLVWEIK